MTSANNGGHCVKLLESYRMSRERPNAEFEIERVVGRRQPPSPLSASDNRAKIIEWRKAFPTPFIPKGVYRFESHEAADEWLWQMLTRPR